MAKQAAEIRAIPANPAAHAAVDDATLTGADKAYRDTLRLDSSLIVRIGQRDEQALGALYDHYGALVYTIALRITQDRALAASIVQDVFYALWQSARSFQIGASVRVWLIDTARQLASEAARPRTTRLRLRGEAYPEKQATRDDTQNGHSADVLTVLALLEALPTDQRETLELAYYDGLTCREIATRLREPVSAIKARLRGGLSTLSKALSNAEAHLGEPTM